jgi:hypothetical protein
MIEWVRAGRGQLPKSVGTRRQKEKHVNRASAKIDKTDADFLLRVAEFFDADYYYKTYPDVAAAKVDALKHYCTFGWRELRDPSSAFSTSDYLAYHPEVKKAGQNPLFHHILQLTKSADPEQSEADAPPPLALDFFPNGLVVPPELLSDLTETGQKLIAEALEKQVAKVPLDKSKPARRPQSRIEMATHATIELYHGRHYLEAAVLSSAFLRSLPLLRLHLASCLWLNRAAYTCRMLTELSEAAEPGSQEDAILLDARARHGVFLAGDTNRFFKNPYPGNPHEPEFLDAIEISGHDLEWQENVLKSLQSLRNDIDDNPEWKTDFRKGCVLAKFFIYAASLATQVTKRLSTTVLDNELAQAHQRFLQLPIRKDPAALQEIRESWAEGRSIVVLLPHAGFIGVSEQQLMELGIPVTKVAAQALSDYSNPDNIIIAASGNNPFDFVKMVQGLKTSPRLLIIYPDGEHGEQRKVSLLGRPMSLGKGAAMIAYRCKSPTFFLKTIWRDGMISQNLTKGPRAEAYADQESFSRALDDFYLEGLQSIVMGPPLEMAPLGGFWHHLLIKPA